MAEHLLQVAREAVFVESLCSGDPDWALRELAEVTASSLKPQPETLRALGALLTADTPQLSKAAAAFLSSASAHLPFRSKAVEGYTQALSEEGVEAQRGACAALSCLQAHESVEAVVSLCDSADEELRHVAIETLLTLGEEGRLAYTARHPQGDETHFGGEWWGVRKGVAYLLSARPCACLPAVRRCGTQTPASPLMGTPPPSARERRSPGLPRRKGRAGRPVSGAGRLSERSEQSGRGSKCYRSGSPVIYSSSLARRTEACAQLVSGARLEPGGF
ncbi:hypothetical protein ANANG_G00179040 [Anguilla anguilla]|uniref:HEAT repeat domain-containing protein n=1 Tax=Anguilla anguilla TaxID=7936 RepID=A0A9D3M673_ANGAN|nr:hypothetical protein ANANG_G00179040 [Anguilla anguilla]